MTKFPISPIFIPANKLEYVDKALNSGADGIIFDLEDSVLQEDKISARDNLYAFLVKNSLDWHLLGGNIVPSSPTVLGEVHEAVV